VIGGSVGLLVGLIACLTAIWVVESRRWHNRAHTTKWSPVCHHCYEGDRQ
jgi:hypothetical protein